MWVCRHNIYIEICHVKTPTDVMPTSHLNVIDAMTELCDNISVNVMLHVFFGIFFPFVCLFELSLISNSRMYASKFIPQNTEIAFSMAVHDYCTEVDINHSQKRKRKK